MESLLPWTITLFPFEENTVGSHHFLTTCRKRIVLGGNVKQTEFIMGYMWHKALISSAQTSTLCIWKSSEWYAHLSNAHFMVSQNNNYSNAGLNWELFSIVHSIIHIHDSCRHVGGCYYMMQVACSGAGLRIDHNAANPLHLSFIHKTRILNLTSPSSQPNSKTTTPRGLHGKLTCFWPVALGMQTN